MNEAAQTGSGGISLDEIWEAVLAHADPRPGLRWVDVGCGTGDALRGIRDRHAPAALAGVDILDWLADDLRGDVDLRVGPAEEALDSLPAADRVLLIETIEHLEAPWTVLRAAARAVTPGGRIVVSTPNVGTLRTRAEFALSGRLTAFRPGNEPHLTPALPHVTARILREEGLDVAPPAYAGLDIVPKSGGRHWPRWLQHRAPHLTNISVLVAAERPR